MRRDRAIQSPSMGFAQTGYPYGMCHIAPGDLVKSELKMLIYYV